jgi:formate-dependent nitrite reductase cytochrome c552 subunit
LADEELCESCHRDEAEHWLHHGADVHCVDCHIYLPEDSTDSTDVRVGTAAAVPNHSFREAAEACVVCHGPEIHEQVEFGEITTDRTQLATMAGRARDLAFELEDAKKTNRSLQTMSVVSLGFGLGTGGVLGAIFVLVIGYVAQGRKRQ